MMENDRTPQEAFIYYLYTTLTLLGCDPEVATCLLCMDLVDDAAVNRLRQYNIRLIEDLKGRLSRLTTMTVRVGAPPEEENNP